MTKLQNVYQVDVQLRLAVEDLKKWGKAMANEKNFSEAQSVQFSYLSGAIVHLTQAMQDLVNHNR